MITPWKPYVTVTPAPFMFKVHRETANLYVLLGHVPSEGIACRLVQRPQRIDIVRMATQSPTPSARHKIQLSPWSGKQVPTICLHPFAFLHLIISRQAPLNFQQTAAKMMQRPTTEILVHVEDHCDLLCMLKVDAAYIRFGSQFDLEVT